MRYIVGIDEVGRGSWAGPLVAGAVILRRPIDGLRDSKKLTKLQRQKYSEIIHSYAPAIGLGWVTPKQIDKLGLTKAIALAMNLAIKQIEITYHEVIIDGNFNFLPLHPYSKAIAKADETIACVSAASIVAKVARDKYMAEISSKYPEYGFETNVGYGTAKHIQALNKYGICNIHRKSFRPVSQLGLD